MIHAPVYCLTQTGTIFSARCNMYISRLCYDVSVRLSVTEVHWRIIANLGFKFRSHFTAHCGCRAACVRIILRHMLSSARVSCCLSATLCNCDFKNKSTTHSHILLYNILGTIKFISAVWQIGQISQTSKNYVHQIRCEICTVTWCQKQLTCLNNSKSS